MRPPTLGPGETHLWTLDLDSGEEDASALSADEKERARRYRFERDTARYVASRAGLRRILSLYAGAAAAELVFEYGPNGKPALRRGPPQLRFNLTHSDAKAVVALRLGEEVGVDIERLRAVPDAASMVERYFSARARAGFAALPEAEKAAGFLRLWTRQEAYLKALGQGLAGPLDAEPADGWRIVDFEPAAGYVGALASRGLAVPPQLFSK